MARTGLASPLGQEVRGTLGTGNCCQKCAPEWLQVPRIERQYLGHPASPCVLSTSNTFDAHVD